MTLGQQLRAAREEKGVSIEQAAEATRVKADTLLALEADDYSKMPAPVYSKGFLKIYAQYLGLDAQRTREEFDRGSGAAAASPMFHKAAVRLGQSPVDRIISSMATMWGMWMLVGAIIVVLVLIVWVVFSAARRGPDSSRGAQAPKPATSAVPPPPRPASNAPPANPNAYIRPMQPRPAVLETKTNAVSAAEQKPPAAPLTVSIRLSQDCWVQVVLDGKTTLRYGIKKSGWTYEWPAQKSVRLTVGNAAAAHVRVNGRDQKPLGGPNQKVTINYAR